MPLQFPDNGKEDDFTCWGKHRILKSLLDSNDFSTRFRVCEFLWSEQKIPKRILGIPHYDKDYHLFLEVKIYNNWVIVDCTNDSKLPDFNKWDCKSNCKIAVKQKNILPVEEGDEIIAKQKQRFMKYFEQNKNFYAAMNKWLDSERK